jgi:hypothetical protein
VEQKDSDPAFRSLPEGNCSATYWLCFELATDSWIRELEDSEVPVKAAPIDDTTSVEDGGEPVKVECDQNTVPPTRFRKLANSLGFETLYLAFRELRGDSINEEKKVVLLEKHLWTSCYVSLFHLTPSAASITLMVLIWKGYYIGSELSGLPRGGDGLKFLGLQFASKLLELLAVGSLSTILFALVRTQLLWEKLPFGAVTAGFEFNRLSFLWSKEFLATCATNFKHLEQKVLLVATVIIFTLLATSIGPSAAVASSPVLRNWPAGGSSFWLNATSQQLWPSHLDDVAVLDLPCAPTQNNSCFPSNGNVLASELLSLWPPLLLADADDDTLSNVVPEKATIPGRRSMHTMAVRFKGPFSYQPYITTVTTPLAAIADALSQVQRYWFVANEQKCITKPSFCVYNDIFFTANAQQPVTYVRCLGSALNSTMQFSRLDKGLGNYPAAHTSNATLGSQQWYDFTTANGTIPGLSWIDLAEADFGQTSIGAAVALPGPTTKDNPNNIFACTVDARWAQTSAALSFLGGPMIVSGLPDNWLYGGQYQLDSKGQWLWPQVTIAPEWGDTINSVIGEPSQSLFANLCNSVARMGNITMVPWSINAVESVLALMITDGLARTSSMAMTLGSLKGLDSGEWRNELLPKGTVFGGGGSAFNYTYQPGDQATMFEATVSVNGYGYGVTTATVLATVVLSIYTLIAMTYVTYSICFAKTTSNSWESITDLVALGLNSRPPSTLKNTGAGIATLGSLKEKVSIGVNDDRLQMVFEKDGNGQNVINDEPYG